jgi:hypothetical protein
MACRTLALIRSQGKSKQWSLAGVMDHLSKVHCVQIANEWRLAEVVGKTKKMLAELGIELNLSKNLLPNY